MKPKTAMLSCTIALAIINVAHGANDIEFTPANGSSFVVKDGLGQTKTLEITSNGDILINGKFLDSTPPTIRIDAPTVAIGATSTVTLTAEDDEGIFKVLYVEGEGSSEDSYLQSGEETVVIDRIFGNRFGNTNILKAYAIDLSGNVTIATHEIASDVALKTGSYALDSPIMEEFSPQGCGGNAFEIMANNLIIDGYYKQQDSKCDSSDVNEDPVAVACISASIDTPIAPFYGAASGAINSVGVTSFSLKSSFGFGDTLTTLIDFDFFDTTPATIGATMTIMCESANYGTEKWGPVNMQGSLTP